ncbi:MAG: glutaredoxin 3 [Alphaproteobacteria bacterium]
MAEIELYSSFFCPFCHRAKSLLKKKGVAFTEIDVTTDPARRTEMTARAGGRSTVPQIFVDGAHIGDCDDIHALDRAGKLVPLLAGAS